MLAQIGFGLLATCLVASGLLAVTSPHLVRAVLWLAVALVTTAVLYVTLSAPFLAGIQVLLYAGGVITLMLFGVMLTEQKHDVTRANPSHRAPVGGLIAAAVFGILAGATLKTPLPDGSQADSFSVETIGTAFLATHQLAFEALSILLLAAMIGAIVLARKGDP